MLRILHTADWHLGRQLFGQRRDEEFAAFLDWLLQLAAAEADVLIVAGDIFDSPAPPNSAQEQYYSFLSRLAQTACRHTVIIGGNHDSPSFLNAPRALLKNLRVHVIGCIGENPEDEILSLCNEQGELELIVCAVPYLRDRDIRRVQPGESLQDKNARLQEGIRAHYAAVAAAAAKRRGEADVPVIATGHLFAAGAQSGGGDGMRELYVGSLAQIDADAFPPLFDYVALGHLHRAQIVGGREHIRYSGSPLALGFGDGAQEKQVLQLTLTGDGKSLRAFEVPVWRRLVQIRGDLPALEAALHALRGQTVWVEALYDGAALLPDLREKLHAAADENVKLLRIRNLRARNERAPLSAQEGGERFRAPEPEEIFTRLLEMHAVPEAQRPLLLDAHAEILEEVRHAH